MPSIVVLDQKGMYLSHLPTSSELTTLEIRNDSGAEFRGYNRPVLLRELEKMREAALKS